MTSLTPVTSLHSGFKRRDRLKLFCSVSEATSPAAPGVLSAICRTPWRCCPSASLRHLPPNGRLSGLNGCTLIHAEFKTIWQVHVEMYTNHLPRASHVLSVSLPLLSTAPCLLQWPYHPSPPSEPKTHSIRSSLKCILNAVPQHDWLFWIWIQHHYHHLTFVSRSLCSMYFLAALSEASACAWKAAVLAEAAASWLIKVTTRFITL